MKILYSKTDRECNPRRAEWGFCKKTIRLLIPFIFLLSCQTGPEEQSFRDWSDVTLLASGNASIEGEWTTSKRVRAVQQAKINVYTNIESQIMSLRTGAGKRILDWAEENNEIRRKISAFVRGAKIVGLENSGNGIKVEAELYLGENFEATIGLARRKQNPPPSPGARKKEF
ncbi:MAG: hypothetical protein ACE5FZ_05955 [Nitrospiria bacterium]